MNGRDGLGSGRMEGRVVFEAEEGAEATGERGGFAGKGFAEKDYFVVFRGNR